LLASQYRQTFERKCHKFFLDFVFQSIFPQVHPVLGITLQNFYAAFDLHKVG